MIFGSLILLAGITLVINSDFILGFLKRNSDNFRLHILAATARIILGALLIIQSGESKFPFVILIIGWLSLVAGVFLVLIGRQNFARLMSLAISTAKPFTLAGGALAGVFGGFLIYAFL